MLSAHRVHARPTLSSPNLRPAKLAHLRAQLAAANKKMGAQAEEIARNRQVIAGHESTIKALNETSETNRRCDTAANFNS